MIKLKMNLQQTKIGVLGDSTTGKTSLVQLYISEGNLYPREYHMVGLEDNRSGDLREDRRELRKYERRSGTHHLRLFGQADLF